MKWCGKTFIALFAAFSCAASAQSYPARPVTLIVPFSAGGSTDIVARILAQEMGASLGKSVIVENLTGGGGVIGWNSVAKAAPDGYTLLTAELSFAIAAGLIPNLPYDPKKSFTHIATAVSVPHALVVHPSVKANTLQEFVALVKASPGKFNYGSGGNGTNTHLGSELLKSLAGIDMVHIPYKGAGAVLQDLMAGQVQSLISSVPTVLPHVKSGKLRALMVTSEKRVSVLPDVPSARDAGLPEMVMTFWVNIAAPAGTPQPIVERLNKEVIAALARPGTQTRLADLGLDPIGSTAPEAAKLVDDEMQRWDAVIKAARIKAD
ncbi:MAG: tripartite tricarboxylate transporter substrate binding protein [Betaproteobacteria bacterium]|nr:tripartite tricarboxylate transporter substrate binding protein [Betaproteobacteria bacterium]